MPDFRVLVVDDDSVSRVLLAKAAGNCSCQVHAVSTVRQALERLEQYEYGVVLLDCHLPDGHGSKVVEAIRNRKRHPRTAIVAISSDNSRENVEKVLLVGAERFLPKPFSVAEISALLRSYCQPLAVPPVPETKVRELA